MWSELSQLTMEIHLDHHNSDVKPKETGVIFATSPLTIQMFARVTAKSHKNMLKNTPYTQTFPAFIARVK